MAAKFWSNVTVAVQSALASAVTIDSGAGGVTAANPAVVSYSGTDPTDGDYVLFSAQGMSQLDGMIGKVGSVNTGADTFNALGIDSRGFDTFSSGSFQVITFGNSMTNAVGISASGGDYETADVTTIHDTVRKLVPTVASALQYTFECLWDPADAGLAALKAASDAKDQLAIRFTFSDGTVFVFSGYVGCSMAPTGSAQEAVKTTVTITAFGRPTSLTA